MNTLLALEMCAMDEPESRYSDDPLDELVLFWSQIQGGLQSVFSRARQISGRQEQVRAFVESAMTWGSVGLLVGAVNSPIGKLLTVIKSSGSIVQTVN